MGKIKDIFFDLDRTLWDFEKNSESALNIMFDEFNLGDYIQSFELFLEHYKKVNKRFWSDYSKGLITREDVQNGRFTETLKIFQIENSQLGKQMDGRYIEISPYQPHLFPHTKQVLNQLKSDDYKLHIITNGFKEVQHLKLKHSGLLDYFEVILCSEEVGKNKPHPEIFLKALQRASTDSSHSIMIGDDFECDVIGAENVGISGILFDPLNHFSQNPPEKRITDLTEIPDLILGI